MQRILENLRARPTHERRRISLQAASGIMAVVFVIWISTLGIRLAGRVEPSHVADRSPSDLVAAVGAAKDMVKDGWGKTTSALSSAGGSSDVTWSATSSPVAPRTAEPAVVLTTANPDGR